MTGLTILILAAVHLLIVLAAFVVLCLPQEIDHRSDQRQTSGAVP